MRLLRTLRVMKSAMLCTLSLVLVVGFSPIAHAETLSESDVSGGDAALNDSQMDSDAEDAGQDEGGANYEPDVSVDDEQLNNDPMGGVNEEESPDRDTHEEVMPASTDEDPSLVERAALYAVDFDQAEGTEMKMLVPNAESLLSTKRADSVKVVATMSYGGHITRQVVAQFLLSDIVSSGSVAIDFKTYGKFSVNVSFLKGGSVVKGVNNIEVGVSADEYNIAPVSGTFPVLLFSLSMMSSDSSIPTIVMLERTNAYDWSRLPQSVFAMPYLTESEIASTSGSTHALFNKRSDIFAAYVADLYEMNPSAKFNLFINDFHVGLIHSIIYANGIPEKNCSIKLLQDGVFSYNMFNTNYKGSNPGSVNDNFILQWNKAKNEAYKTGKVSSGFKYADPRNYVYAVASSDSQVDWWITRNDQFSSGDGNVFAEQAKSVVTVKNISDMFKDLSSRGEAATAEFKALYNFSEEYFADAEQSGKKIMMILGTRVNLETNFDQYARFTEAFYGEEYAYYYKGHPGTPTPSWPNKVEQLKKLDIIDVDSSIAAEIILFYYPNIYLSGYKTSVFLSASADRAGGLYAMTKKDALASSGEDYSIMDWFISPASSYPNASIKSLCGDVANCFVVEFSDALLEKVDYKFAIWDDVRSSIRYYTYDSKGNPVFVRETQGNSSGSAFEGGLCTIGSSLAGNKLVDVKSGSTANGANVQLYGGNYTPAQRYRFESVGGGYYKIVNVKSGLVLDVKGAGKKAGTNVQQYKWNNSDAQKWQVASTGDGKDTFRIVSKCNGLSLDVSGGRSANGTNIQVYTKNNSDAQKFSLNLIKPSLGNGEYTFKTALKTSQVLDVKAASKANKANVQIYGGNGSNAQKLSLRFDEKTGYYTCTFKCSGKVLDVANGKTANKTNVWQYQSNGTWAQKWSLIPDGKGFRVISAVSGKALDVNAGKTANKTNVQIYQSNGTKAQLWHIDKAS